jgi:hypothetical protein
MDSQKQLFFSARNKSLLLFNLNRDFGGKLTDIQSNRLDKTLSHYMREVYAANNGSPVPLLNREAINVTKTDFNRFLSGPPPAPKPILKRPPPPAKMMGTPIEDVAQERLMQGGKPTVSGSREFMFQDTGRTLEQLQKERAGNQPERPAIPDFRILNEDEDGPSPMELYELAKKARETEALAQAAAAPSGQLPSTTEQPRLQSMDIMRTERPSVSNTIEMPNRLPAPIETKKSREEPALEPPPRVMPVTVGTVMQKTLIREENLLQYKEIEQNLFINSADRDWVRDSLTNQNRYNFTVSFDPGVTTQGATLTPSAIKKFRNIVRIELIKVIVPKETLDIYIRRADFTLSGTNRQTNVLAFPFVVAQVSELDGNNQGTNTRIDQSFGVIHYDATWTSEPLGSQALARDATDTPQTGFVSLIPKFLKCQKVYEPTPLATLQKLSIRLQRPDSTDLLSGTADTLSISMIRLGSEVATSIYRSGAPPPPSAYIFVQTSTYFSRYMWEQGDRVRLAAAPTFPGATPAADRAACTAVLEYLNQESGLLLVAIGTTADALVTVADGPNAVGYANVLIFQSRYTDPTTGGLTPYNFATGGATEITMNNVFETSTYAGNMINQSHQVQAVFRIVTRELDPTTKIRPDNTY